MKMTCLTTMGLVLLAIPGCLGSEPEGLTPAISAATTVKMDFYHRPLPEIPLPNDIATLYDGASATGRRINASMLADTRFEEGLRRLIDKLDGWGVFQPITIPFTGPLDVDSILKGHSDTDYDQSNDVVYLINVDRTSPEFGTIQHLDVGNGSYPVVLEQRDKYWKNDPRADTVSLLFEDDDEDTNHNGHLDPGEDTDADGILDTPNYLPGKTAARDDIGGRADALMSFYEKETNTLILRLMTPLRERTTYAVVITRRLKDSHGDPVGSPFPYINHVSQNESLAALPEVLPRGLSMEDVAFAFSYTTQSIQSHMIAVRDGLYGHGVQAHLGQDFPAEVDGLEQLKNMDFFKGSKNPYILNTEQFLDAYDLIAQQLLGRKPGTLFYKWALDAQHYVDYHAIGSFTSPQLFMRTDKDGNTLGLNDQSWPPDLDRTVAPARKETVYFWLVVPRKEISARGQGKPVPVVVLGHGYTSNRFEALAFGAYLARFGLATLAIDCVSHGLGLSKTEQLLAKAVTSTHGVEPFLDAALKDRAADLNGDGTKDSGGDFWTAYAFHTRDVVRQSALDYMQLIRVFRGFDGKRRWKVDTNGDGKADDLAGDFDGDGVLDVGGPAGAFHMTGGSLGGIMSLFMGGIEPALSSIAPISGAAGLGEVALRSRQGGVPEPVFLRVMGPLFTGTQDPSTGLMKIETIVVDVNDKQELHLADVAGVRPGDTVVVEDRNNKQLGCAYVTPTGVWRANLAADLDDRIRLLFYSGDVLDGKDCRRRSGATPRVTVDTFEHDVTFQAKTHDKGTPLVALAEGLGLQRASPELRRIIGWKQMILDPGDPVAYARNYQLEPLVYAGGEQTGTHTLMVPTIGDMNVPMSTGVTAARASGLLDYLKVDPRYGKSDNQVLIDTYAMEATDVTKRFVDSTGRGVNMDIDDYSEGKDRFGSEVPRLSPPLRLGLGKKDLLGGASAMVLPISSPQGTHGFDFPGQMTDDARSDCNNACADKTGPDPCGCDAKKYFDVGFFMFHLLGNYFVSGGTQLTIDECYGYDTCTNTLPMPALRDKSTLP